MIFHVKDYEVLGNLNKEINKMWSEGKTPYITIKDKSEDRTKAQNRLMHLWFKDIAKSTGQGLIYEAGRCKMQYFLPVLKMSENEEAQTAYYVARELYKKLGHEKFVEVLGMSVIGTTRFLKASEFAEALTNMQFAEAEHNLTDPAFFGIDNWGK